MLKRCLFVFVMLIQLVTWQLAFAGTKAIQTGVNTRYNNNPTYIHNNTTADLAYQVLGTSFFNSVYGVARGSYDTYHAAVSDNHAYIMVGSCNKFQFPDKCLEYNYDQMGSCVNSFYNINDVSDIYINADNRCTVKCRDGSATSCIN